MRALESSKRTLTPCSTCQHDCVSARTSRCIHCGVRFCCWCDEIATVWIEMSSVACGVRGSWIDPACAAHAKEWGTDCGFDVNPIPAPSSVRS